MPFPFRKIARRLIEGDNTNVTEEIGAALEDVVGWTLCALPGVRILHRDFVNRMGSTELDLFLFNSPRESPVDFLPQFLVVECKNWRANVNSATIRDFVAKVRSTKQKVGILVAANGVTGDPDEQTRANDVIREAYDAEEIKILVLTRAEIEAFRSEGDVVRLFEEKYGKACLRSTRIG